MPSAREGGQKAGGLRRRQPGVNCPLGWKQAGDSVGKGTILNPLHRGVHLALLKPQRFWETGIKSLGPAS